ncbi:MAG: helix-turn-helix domain-containing protein [Bacilli bacterium]|nr:helix-turn-helix domain-containing protein [Bacilli bacterium]
MDQIKIGKFIAEKRKAKNMTQSQLAERLCVTDRAVSKWECGRSLPDTSNILELCEILEISVNELLTGKELNMESYNAQAEANLLEAVKQKEESDKRLLRIEIVIGLTGTISFFVLLITGVLGYRYWDLPLWAMIAMGAFGFVLFIIACLFALRIEQKAGYYECKECHHRFVPTYAQTLLAPHVHRSRYMKCPHCGKKTYCRKVISEKE